MPEKTSTRSQFRIKPLCAALLFAFSAQSAQANPLGASMVNGQASFAASGNTLTVTNTPGAIINWQSFSIGQNEITRFAQQSAASTVLNRVTSNIPSSILGTLQSNGRVFLVNPNGIIFGQGSTVDVAGLVATTLNLSNADFLAGRYSFSQAPGAANIRNAGNITAQNGGQIYLIAPNVENTGVITAPNGEILLAAGHSVELVNSNDPNLRVSITAPAGDATNVGQLIARSGSLGLFGAVVRNSGTVSADSAALGQNGKIVFKASSNVILDNNSVTSASGGSVNVTTTGAVLDFGNIRADAGGSVNVQADRILQTGAISATAGGNITLHAQNGIIQTETALLDVSNANGTGGEINVNAGQGRLFSSATMDATGLTGGTLHLLGKDIFLLYGQLDASGQQNGGTILIGGDAHGANPAITNALTTYINSTTTIKADGGVSIPPFAKGGQGGFNGVGNGGRIIIWSDQSTQYYGNLTAKGGALGGNGGFAEVSGKNTLTFGGLADLSAANGINGTLLLDPMNIIIASASGGLSAFQLLDPNPAAGNMFGQNVTVLPNDNVVVAVPTDSFAATNAGAVYLFDGTTGSLLSALTGSLANDQVGSDGITQLYTTGNYLVSSLNWNSNAGAVTWGSSAAGVSGAVSASNSLVGSTANDWVGSYGITQLYTTGNYLVNSPAWNNGTATNAGAVTWGSGTAGVVGVVSSSNSLVGSTTNDQVGIGGITQLYTTGNYLVSTLYWNNGTETSAGAVTWGNGTTGVSGVVSSANSLVGSTAYDQVGDGGVTQLYNGNYLVSSGGWHNGAVTQAGAVTWGSGTAGVTGVVSSANSLVGSTAGDAVGSGGITQLYTTGNYLVSSTNWNSNAGAVTWGSSTAGVAGVVSASNSLVGSTADETVGSGGITELASGDYVVSSTNWNSNAGAVSWGSGTTGVTGVVSAANSLVGSTANDGVGGNGITLLANGNYLVSSFYWDNVAAGAVNAGAVTWGSGTTGVTGVVSATNSLVGSTAFDTVGIDGITQLYTTGNYLVSSTLWNSSTATHVGAVTWGNGLGGTVGAVSATNSLVGSTANDQVGFGGITELASGNYVVSSVVWNNGAATNAGAVTWGNGTTGIAGVVSAANSLVGSTANDYIGSYGITLLTSGNYLVSDRDWDNGTVTDAGAVAWGSGTAGVVGVVSASNSLVGSTAYDRVGNGGITLLSNGNYLVRTISWNNGTATGAGAVTWGNGLGGTVGAVSATNSLVGSTANDQVGSGGITQLYTTGNYVVNSPNWDNGLIVDAGAVTWGNGLGGTVGAVSATNSLVGSTVGDAVGSGGITQLYTTGNYLVSSLNWNSNAGAVTWGSGTTGVAGAVSSTNSLVGGSAGDFVGLGGITQLYSSGNYLVVSQFWHNGAVTQAGAVTWGSGTAGVTGVVSASNSLVGSTAGDMVGDNGITLLANGNYLVSTLTWHNGTAANAGAVTWGNGLGGTAGAVSAANSLVGGTANDWVGSAGITALGNGNYLVNSTNWDNGAVVDAGAVTWGNGLGGTVGAVSSTNSLVGSTAYDMVGSGGIIELASGDYLVYNPNWDNGTVTDASAVTWGNGLGGTAGVVSAANSLVGSTTFDLIGSDGITELASGNILVSSSYWDNGALVNAGRVDIITPATSGGSPAPWGYADYASQSITITPALITAITNTGTAVTLQASNDITVNAAISTLNGALHDANSGGDINLHAGRSILVNANITTDDGNLNLIANDTAANASYRDPGAAQIMIANGVTLDAGTGAINMQMLDGSTGGDITWASAVNVTASSLTLQAVNNILFSAGGAITAGLTPLNVVLSADSDASGAGNIQMNSGSSITSNGGNIVMGGGLDPTTTAAAGSGTATSADASGIYLDGATLDAGAGNISLLGAGAAGTAFGADGIYLTNGSLIQATTGTISLNGTGGAGTNFNSGIRLGTNAALSTVDGAISLTGQGAGSGTDNYGLYIHDGATVTATGTGTITLSGTAATGATSTSNSGVRISASGGATQIASASGAISITGIGGNDGDGLQVVSGAKVQSATGDITLHGTTGDGGTANDGVYLTSTNTAITTSGNIGIVGINTTTVGTGNRGVAITSSAHVVATGTGTITMTGVGGYDGDGLQVKSGALVQSGTGLITLNGTSGNGTGPNFDWGVWVGGAGTAVTGGGMTITGISTSTDATNSNHGVIVDTGAKVTTTAGLMTLTGTKGAGATSDAVLLSGTPAGGVVNAAAGLTINGTGDVVLDTASIINAGTGNVGISASNNILFAANSALAPSAGAVNVALTSDSDGAGGGGIYLGTGSSITSNGGNIWMGGVPSTGRAIGNGTVTGGITFNSGITVLGNITAGAGNVTMLGQGSATAGDGITFTGGLLSSNGLVTIDGLAQAASYPSYVAGVHFMNAGTRLSTATGAVTVTGSNSSTGIRAQGITVEDATIETSGSGTLMFNGNSNTSNTTPDTNWGVGIVGGTVRTTASSGGGAVTLNGAAPVGDGAVVLAGGNVTSSSGEIRMLSSSTGGIGILGSSVVGGASSGNILMKVSASSAIIDLLSGSINAGSSALTLSLAGGTASGNSITAGALRLLGSGTFSLGSTNDIGILAASISSPLSYTDANALVVGSVTSFDGTATTTTSGITASAVTLGTTTSDLTLNAAPVISTAGAVTLNAAGNIRFTGGTSTVTTPGTFFDLNAGGGIFTDPGSVVTLQGMLARVLNGKTWQNNGTINLQPGSAINLGEPASPSSLINTASGTINVNTGGWTVNSNAGSQNGIFSNAGTVNVNTGGSFEAAFSNSGTLNINNAGTTLSLQNAQTIAGIVNINSPSATLWVSEIHGTPASFSGTTINGSGILSVMGGGYYPVANFSNATITGVSLIAGNQGTINWAGGTLAGTGTIGTSGTGAFNISGAGAHVLNGPTLNLGSLTLSGASLVIQSGALNLTGALTLSSGATLLNNGAIAATGGLYNYGVLGGSGSVTGNVFNDGTVAPGNSPGTLSIIGNFTQGPAATLAVELGGTTAGTFDTLNISGMATLDGTLAVSMFGGFTGAVGNIFPVINASTVSGTFATVSIPPGYGFNTNYLPAMYPSSVELELTQVPSALVPQPVLDFLVQSSLPPWFIIPPPAEEKKPGSQTLADLTPAQPDTTAAPMPVCQ